VRNIRVLLAELQRISWPPGLARHARHGVGAVSVMLYCFRRELLLNINELLAGFRLFPSYMRVGGLREDLPRGVHDGRLLSRSFRAEAGRVPGPAHEEGST
jgi:NADH:ubiquinone oxidoreductase subunit D